MSVHGLQKLTLLDFPGRVACTVFLAGCPFRCPYCHNFDLLDPKAEPFMTDDELLTFLRKRKGLLDGVALSGGEPLMRDDIFGLLYRIRELGFPIKLDTNGAYPDRLRKALENGLVDYVAMDIKNSPDHYAETIGLLQYDLTQVNKSVELLLHSGTGYEFRTTVVDELHDEVAFEKIGQWISDAKQYFLQPFTDRDSVPNRDLHAPSEAKLIRCLEAVRPYIPTAEIRGVDLNKKTFENS